MELPRITWSKLAATAIGAVYLAVGLVREELQPILFAAGLPFLPLALIWLADPLATVTGLIPFQWIKVTQRSPAIVIEILGWLMLVGIPLIVIMSRL